jgi:hypothetical protein
MNRAVIHLALAGYMASNPDKQVRRLAKKYKRTTCDPKVKRAMSVVLRYDEGVALLAKETYWDRAVG